MQGLITGLWSGSRKHGRASILWPRHTQRATASPPRTTLAPQSFYPCLFLLVAMVLSCSRGNTPVQAGKIVGKWQRVDQPSVSLSFQKDGGFSAEVASTRVLAGRYQLLDGTRLVLVCDAASFKASRVTNQVALVRGQLNIGTPDGRTEKYKRAK